jgi:hypothetical protein
MKFRMILLVALFAIPLTTHGQNSPAATPKASPPPVVSSHLQITASTKAQSVGSTLVGNAKCDDDGNIYARTEHPEDEDDNGTKVPVQRIRPDGSVTGSFRVTDAGPDISAMDFFVSGDGKVYEDAWTHDGKFVHILEFSSDGSLKSNLALDPETSIYPYQIAVFKSGEFLVSGLHGLHVQTPFTAVFDTKGKLIKKIYEPEDEDSRQKAEAGDAAFVSDSGYGNYYASHGDVALGSDGNAYLLRAVSPALIYVISPKGEVVRKLRIESSDPGWVARTIRSASGRLAISFAQRGHFNGIIRVVDLQGNAIVDYISDDKNIYPGFLSCYTPMGLTFLTTDGKDVHLYKAALK